MPTVQRNKCYTCFGLYINSIFISCTRVVAGEWFEKKHYPYPVDRFTKQLFWNIDWSRPFSMEEYYAESMLENKFCSNVAPSLSSGPPLIYKAKYKGLISQNLYPAITFDWSVIRTWGQRLWAAFLMLFSGIPHLPTLRDTWHMTYVTYVTHVTWHMWRAWRDKS